MNTPTKAIVLTTLLLPLAFAGLAGAAPAGVGTKALASASAQCGPTYAHATADGITWYSATASVYGQTSGSASVGLFHAEAHAYGTGIGSHASASAGTTIPGVGTWSASASCSYPTKDVDAGRNLDGIACKDTDDSLALNGDVLYSGEVAYDPQTDQHWFVGVRQSEQGTDSVAFPSTARVLTFERAILGTAAPQGLEFTGLGVNSHFLRALDGGVLCNANAF